MTHPTLAIALVLCTSFLFGQSSSRGSSPGELPEGGQGVAHEHGTGGGTGRAPGGGPVREFQLDLPESLEEILARALRTNPDVLLAEARVREAQAELNQVRLKVVQETATTFYLRRSLEVLKDGTSDRVRRVERQVAAGAASEEALREAMLARAEAEAKLHQTLAQLQYSVGSGGLLGPATANSTADQQPSRTAARPRPEIPEQYREGLGNSQTIEFQDVKFEELLGFVQQATGLPFVVDPGCGLAGEKVTLRLADVTAAQLLLALCDVSPDETCFVFREYGIFATTRDRAERLSGATIPPGVPYIEN